jgi:hypothetical protein
MWGVASCEVLRNARLPFSGVDRRIYIPVHSQVTMTRVQTSFNIDRDLLKTARMKALETGETFGGMIERLLGKELGTSNGTGAHRHSTPAGQRLKAKKGKR